MTRALVLAVPLFLVALGCVSSRAPATVDAPTLAVTPSSIHEPEFALPFHSARIVDVALLAPQAGEQWRMVSGDLDGWIRFWADGRMIAAKPAHPGGLAALVTARDGTLYTAGFDGRVREWPAGATSPGRSFRFADQVTALAVSDQHLAISDGRYVQLWTRTDTPQLDWSTHAHAFVTGLALSAGGGVIAAAELRESGIRDAIATHPLAAPQGSGLREVSEADAAELAYWAEREFPGAAADFVEVWQPSRGRDRRLVPQASIDADIAAFGAGGVVYREIFDRDQAAVIGRRLEDSAHVSLALVKPWALFSGASEADQAEQPLPSVGDFAVGQNGEIIVVDHFPGWDAEPPAWGWRVGERRELAIGFGYAALGDAMGNVAVVDLAQPTSAGWPVPGEERPELLAAAANQPWFATATLEPRTQYRLWSLADGSHRPLRVEDAREVITVEQAAQFGVEQAPMYPISIALADDLQTLAVSLASFGDPAQAAVRSLTIADGQAQLLTLATKPHPIELALSSTPSELFAWTPGYSGFRWAGPEWTPIAGEVPSGTPLLSANGRYAAHVSAAERTLVDRSSGATLVIAKVDPVISEVGEPIPAALANDGTLAVVEPFGGGVVALLAADGTQALVELPGAATALTWVDDRDGQPVLLVGCEDGSIVRVDRATATTLPVHAGEGGRVWSLAPVGGHAAVFIELDEQGLALHRLDDDAMIELHVADATTLARHAGSPPQPQTGVGLIAIWRPGTAMPICAALDGSRAGLLMQAGIRRLDPSEAPALFEAFMSGGECPKQPPAAAIQPMPLLAPQF